MHYYGCMYMHERRMKQPNKKNKRRENKRNKTEKQQKNTLKRYFVILLET